jgi:hypothetical protein
MHTSTLTASACIVHELSLAIAYGGPTFGKAALQPAVKEISSDKERGKVLEVAWNNFNRINVPAHAIFAASWLITREALKSAHLGKETQKLLTLKDFLVAGAVVTGLANAAASKLMQREFPEGVRVQASGEPSARTAPEAAQFQRFFKTVGPLNMAFVAGAIAVGPVLALSAIKASGRGKGIFARLFR